MFNFSSPSEGSSLPLVLSISPKFAIFSISSSTVNTVVVMAGGGVSVVVVVFVVVSLIVFSLIGYSQNWPVKVGGQAQMGSVAILPSAQ